ncbi:MAG: hypothetical protein KAS07_03405 [Candidatus Pacebacteria bacterium]|nr:hypothetical protein [Candidatus Paceibacterota bacterium]
MFRIVIRISPFILSILLLPVFLYAADASFYLLPDTGVYTVGEEFPVSVTIDTDGADITAAGGNIAFNNEELEVTAISKEGSLFTSWIDPERELNVGSINEKGIIPFEGFIYGGYEGNRGHIMTVTFKALRDISSKIKFQTGSAILAADQKATNILAQMNSGVYTLNAEEVVPTLEYVAPVNTDSLNIISTTHPDQNKWYATTTAVFSWNLEDDVEGLRLLFNKEPNSIPTVFYADPISSKKIENVEEGVWYLHMQINNSVGWGDVAHFKVQTDITDPEYFEIEQIERKDLSDPNPTFIFDAFDVLSGISGYEVRLDGAVGDIVKTTNASSTKTVHQLEKVASGEHTIIVRAIDSAGNSIEDQTSFIVEALPVPKILQYKERVTTGSALSIKGEALGDSEVKVFMSKDEGEPIQQGVLSDAQGSFTYVIEELSEPGEYVFWVQTKNKYGAESDVSEKVTITVSDPGIAVYGGIIVGYLSIIVPLVGLAVLLLVSLWWGWHKFRSYKKRLKKEVDEAGDVLHKEFTELKKITEREISSLERARTYRKLTPEEHSIIKRFKGSFSESQEHIDKEFLDVKNVAEDKDIVQENPQQQGSQQTQPEPQQKRRKMQIRIEKLN